MEPDSSVIVILDDDEPALTSKARGKGKEKDRDKDLSVAIDLTSPVYKCDNDEVTCVHDSGYAKVHKKNESTEQARRRKRKRPLPSNEQEVTIIDEYIFDAKPSAVSASLSGNSNRPSSFNPLFADVTILDEEHEHEREHDAKPSATSQIATNNRNEINENDDVQFLRTTIKVTPLQSAMHQIQEIFPDMLPSYISTELALLEPITSQAVQALIQFFLANSSYPKIQQQAPKKIEKKKEVDYANDEFHQSTQYKYQANQQLLQAFPFMSKQGINRFLHKFHGRYHKTYMQIVSVIKKIRNFDNDVEMYDEFTRLMSGGRWKSPDDRDKFQLEVDGIKFVTTLKTPRRTVGAAVTDRVLLDEMEFTRKKIRSWGKAVQAERNRLVARKKAEETGETVECSCCYGDYASMEMVTCNEGHIFCMDCLRRYVEEKVFGNGDLGKEGSTELCCMDTSGCQSFFNRDQLSRSLSEKIMKKYDELQTTLVLEKAGLSDICKCPKCDFQASLPESEKILKCPSCAYESCRMCGEDSHIPLRCEEVVKDRTETSARLQIEEAMTKARIRYCPKGCKQGFYKVEGCNKMTCPTCKTFICYVCRVEITKDVGYAHFCQVPHCQHKNCKGCPLYSNAEEDDARASSEAGLKAVQELKGDSKTENVAEKMKSIIHQDLQPRFLGGPVAHRVTINPDLERNRGRHRAVQHVAGLVAGGHNNGAPGGINIRRARGRGTPRRR